MEIAVLSLIFENGNQPFPVQPVHSHRHERLPLRIRYRHREWLHDFHQRWNEFGHRLDWADCQQYDRVGGDRLNRREIRISNKKQNLRTQNQFWFIVLHGCSPGCRPSSSNEWVESSWSWSPVWPSLSPQSSWAPPSTNTCCSLEERLQVRFSID